MLTLDEARALIAQRIHVLPPERGPLAQAHGRTLRESVAVSEDIPAFDRSAFDGYALRSADAPSRLRVVAEMAAGVRAGEPLGVGECARIFTGAQLPPGADAVAMQEHVVRDGDYAAIAEIPRGHGVRWRGEDARAGQILLERGQRLGAVECSLLSMLGHTQPLVAPTVRIHHVVTGVELVPPDVTPGPGQIRESNSALLASLAATAGASFHTTGATGAGDDLVSLLGMIQSVPEDSWHMLLLSGGASVGDYDFGRRALEELGFSIHFTALDLRPGKPLIFATRGRQLAFVVPGNPLSHFVCWHVVIRAALDLLVKAESELALVHLPLAGAEPLPGNPRETWWPARIVWREGRAFAEPLKWQSSGDITGLVGVGALLRIPAKSEPIKPGALVFAHLL